MNNPENLAPPTKPLRTGLMIAASILAAVLSACVSNAVTIVATPELQDGQVRVEADGTDWLTSQGDIATVSAAVKESIRQESDYLVVGLHLSNQAEQEIQILPGQFTAQDDNQQSYEILSSAEHVAVLDDMYKRKQQRSASSQIGMADSGSFVHSTAYTGATHFSNTGATTYANPGSQAQSPGKRSDRMEQTYLRATILPAGQDATGDIWIRLPRDQAANKGLLLTIPVGNETHTFRFSLTSS